jgi:hypothetical protein
MDGTGGGFSRTFVASGQRKNSRENYFRLFHRAITALRAISDLRLGESFFIRAKNAVCAISDLRSAESFLARALPPLRPPSRPNATAAGFFFFLTG